MNVPMDVLKRYVDRKVEMISACVSWGISEQGLYYKGESVFYEGQFTHVVWMYGFEMSRKREGVLLTGGKIKDYDFSY